MCAGIELAPRAYQYARAMEYTSITMLFVYPFVRRTSRRSLPRSHECSLSFQFTGPYWPTSRRSTAKQPYTT